jgi:DNA-binding HxlR family transcriptional regulator
VTTGVRRLNDIQRQTGEPRDRLSDRLRKLEAEGTIERRAYSEHPSRYEYVLTESGEALTTVLSALRIWGERYAHKRRTRVEASL